jgi:hypothetical protein
MLTAVLTSNSIDLLGVAIVGEISDKVMNEQI